MYINKRLNASVKGLVLTFDLVLRTRTWKFVSSGSGGGQVNPTFSLFVFQILGLKQECTPKKKLLGTPEVS